MEELSLYHQNKIEKIIEENNITNSSAFIQLYMQKSNNNEKITKEHLDEILFKYKMKLQEEKNGLIEKSLQKIPKNQNVGTNFFSYNNKQYSYFKTQKYINYDDKEVETEEIWFKAKDIAEALGYKDTDKAIRNHVDEKYQKKLIDFSNPAKTAGLTKLTKNQKETIYISEPGLYSLVFSSQKQEAIAFRQYVFEQVLPSLRKYGTFSLRKNFNFNLDTSFIKSFLKKQCITDYNPYNVIYIGVFGTNNGPMCKFGKTDCRIIDRLSELKDTFGNQFVLIAIAITDNNTKAENIFRSIIKEKKLDIELTVNGKKQTEVFITNHEFTLEMACEKLYEIAEDNQSKVVNELKQSKGIIDNIGFIDAKTLLEIRIQERLKEEAIARQKEADIKLAEINKDLIKEKKEEIKEIKETKEEIKEEPKYNNDKDIYWQFLLKYTENSDKHIHMQTLYDKYKDWFKNNNPNAKIPSNKEFTLNIKKYKEIKKHTRVNNRVSSGIFNLKLKDDEF